MRKEVVQYYILLFGGIFFGLFLYQNYINDLDTLRPENKEKGKIIEIPKCVHRGNRYLIIGYKGEEYSKGISHESCISIERKFSVGDEIDIFFNKSTQDIILAKDKRFLEEYSFYIAMFMIFFSPIYASFISFGKIIVNPFRLGSLELPLKKSGK
ncbi:MAG: hypothetical protein ACJAT4_001829 [Granulosicoccus sp.]|jgi:hypothetical protein